MLIFSVSKNNRAQTQNSFKVKELPKTQHSIMNTISIRMNLTAIINTITISTLVSLFQVVSY